MNANGQIVIRNTGLPGTDHLQRIYVLHCALCDEIYGANGSDIHGRKCPECQGGRPGLPFRSIAVILVRLLDEDVDVWRPCCAALLSGTTYKVLGPVVEDETWEFPRGAIVGCESRKLSDGPALVAVARATVS